AQTNSPPTIKPKLTMVITIVPEEQEKEFLKNLTAREKHVIIFDDHKGTSTKHLDRRVQSEQVIRLPDTMEFEEPGSYANQCQPVVKHSRSPATEFTEEGVKKFGILVSLIGTGVFASSFFKGGNVSKGLAGTAFTMAMQQLSNAGVLQ